MTNVAFRVFSLSPLRFLSSKLSTCDQLSYRTEHMRTLSSATPSAGHAQFLRRGCRCAHAFLGCTFRVLKQSISVHLQEGQHLGVLPGGRGPRPAAHVVALQRRSHQHAGQRAGPRRRRKSGPTPQQAHPPQEVAARRKNQKCHFGEKTFDFSVFCFFFK